LLKRVPQRAFTLCSDLFLDTGASTKGGLAIKLANNVSKPKVTVTARHGMLSPEENLSGGRSVLELKLFGVPELRWNNEGFGTPPAKVFAMLCYLSLHANGCSRKDLAELLWETTKTGSVRVALSELRHLPGSETWLETQDQLVKVHAVTDLTRFEEALQAEDFANAIAIWQDGEAILKGFELRGGEPFKNWLELERSRLSELYLEALQGHMQALEANENYSKALRLAKGLLQKDKFNETVHRTIMRLEHKRGNTEAALAQFESLRQVLQEELEVEPLEETLDLLREIEQGGVSAAKSALLLTTSEDIPAKPDKLIGRAELLTEIEERLETDKRVLLHGFGGTGKTALAASFVSGYLEESEGPVLWLQAGDDGPDALFDAIAGAFEARQAISQSQNKTKAIHTLLAKAQLSLLVLDDVWNAYALSKLSEALPEDLPLLVTARQRYPKLKRIDVGRLERESALELLSHHAQTPLDDSADSLCELLGDHAFALRIAGVTLNVDELSASDLLGSVKNDPLNMKLPADLAEQGRESVASLLNVTTQALSDEAHEALLAFGVMFTSSCTPELLSLCIRREEEATEDALIELQKRALADRVTEAGSDVVSYRLHDLVFSFAKVNNNLRDLTAMRACNIFLEKHQQHFDVLDVEINNLLGATQLAEQQDDALFVDMMQRLSVGDAYYQARGHSSRSVKLLESSVAIAKEIEEIEIAHHLASKLGNIYREFYGDLDNALTAYKEALYLSQKLHDYEREATLMSIIGVVLFQQNSDDADTYLEKAYRLSKTHHKNMALIHVLQNMSFVAGVRENYRRAHELCIEAVEIVQKLANNAVTKQPETIYNLYFALFNLGVAEMKLKHFDKAHDTLGKALEIAQHNNNQVWEAYVLQEIGDMYHLLKNQTLAQENYDKSLDLYYQNNATADSETLTSFMIKENYDIERWQL